MDEANWRAFVALRAKELKEERGLSEKEAVDIAMQEIHEEVVGAENRRKALLINFHAAKPSFEGWVPVPGVKGALTGAWAIDVDDLLGGRAVIPPYEGELDEKEQEHRISAFAELLAGVNNSHFLSRTEESQDQYYVCRASGGFGEVFLPDQEDDKILYCQFRCREASAPSEEVVKRLRKRYKKKQLQGKGVQEYFTLNMFMIIRISRGLIPLGVESVSQFVDVLSNPFTTVLRWQIRDIEHKMPAGLAAAEVERTLRMILYRHYLAYRALTESDTPMWVAPTEDLALMLANTDAKGVFGRDVQLPAAVVNILVPPRLFMLGPAGDANVLSISLCASPTKRGRLLDILALSSEIGPTKSESGAPPITQFMSCKLEDDDEISLSQLKENFSARLETDDYDNAGSIGGRSMKLSEFGVRVFNFCVNILLFITSQSDITKQKKQLGTIEVKRGKGKKKQKRPLSEIEEWVIGTEVKLDTESRRSFRRGASSSISYSFIVRGHWRNQPYGPRKMLRKRIWIKPFVKGGDLSRRILGHTYKGADEG